MIISLKLGALSVINISLAFIYQCYLITALGPGGATDAFFTGMTVPQLIVAIFCGSLLQVIVPIFTGETGDTITDDIWAILILTIIAFGILGIALIITSEIWVPLMVPGFNESIKNLAISVTRIHLVGMLFMVINCVLSSSYVARQQFLWPEYSFVFTSFIALLLMVYLLPRFGLLAAAWIGVARSILQTILLSKDLKRPISPNIKGNRIQKLYKRLKVLVCGAVYYKTDPLVDRVLLSFAGSGSLSLYYLAQQIYAAINQVLFKAVSVPLVSLLSKFRKRNDMKRFKNYYNRLLFISCLVSVVGLLIFVLIGHDILTLLVGHGSVTVENIDNLWWIMIGLGGMFVGSVMGQITSSTFYSLGDTTTPTRIGVYSYSVYIPIKILLFYYYGLMGIAIATSLFFSFNFLFQYMLIQKNIFNSCNEVVLND